jgi:hypothetical protein
MSIGTTTTTPLAAKPHACEVCGKMIEVGERYSRIKGNWEGEWQNWAAHTICLEIYDDNAEEGVTSVGWFELVEMTTTAEQLESFLARFPPADDEEDKAEAANRQFGFLGEHLRRAHEAREKAAASRATSGPSEEMEAGNP